MLCRICETRRPRRYCLGVGGDICAICCGTEREETVHCPFDCEYLQEAHKREQPPHVGEADFPNKDIPITESFLRENQALLLFLTVSLLKAAVEIPGVVDSDLKDGLQGLVRTYRTLQSGLYYDSRPDNPLAGAIYDRMRTSVEEMRASHAQKGNAQSVRDASILGVFAFLEQLEMQHRNGRRLGRAFIDFLRVQFPETMKHQEGFPSLIV